MANGKQAGKKKARRGKKKAEGKPTQQQENRQKTVTRKRNRKSKTATMGVGTDTTWLNEAGFVKLTTDPCNGPLTASPFGATENAYIWRLNFRRTVTSNASGHLMTALYPLGMYNGSGSVTASTPQAVQTWGGASLTDTALTTATGGDYIPGVQQLVGMAAQIRVTAGCIKLKYLGPASAAAGELYCWEGQGDENFAHSAGTSFMVNRASPQWFCLNGRTASITSGVEAALCYAKAPAPQNNYGDVAVARTDVYCPMAVCGVSGGPASTQYVIEATVIVEWTPMLSAGIPNANVTLVKPGAAERVANVIKQLAPMLVRAGDTATGGYAGMFSKAVKFGAQVYRSL